MAGKAEHLPMSHIHDCQQFVQHQTIVNLVNIS